MRALVLAPALLLASSALYPASATDPKTDVQTYQQQRTTDENSDKTTIDRNSDSREVGRDWKMKPGDGQTVGKAGGAGQDGGGQKIDRDWKAHPDRN